jgi:hypothetical protein
MGQVRETQSCGTGDVLPYRILSTKCRFEVYVKLYRPGHLDLTGCGKCDRLSKILMLLGQYQPASSGWTEAMFLPGLKSQRVDQVPPLPSCVQPEH